MSRSNEASSSDDAGAPPPKRLAITMRPPSPELGSFSFAIKDLGDTISILGIKYVKAPILKDLNLKEEDICLPSFLSNKGVAACILAGTPGHERADSAAHIFSEAANKLRSSFDQYPYRLPHEGPYLYRRGGGGQNRNSYGRGKAPMGPSSK